MDDSEWRKLCGSSFQVVGAVKEADLWLNVLVKRCGLDWIRESVDERRGRAGTYRDSDFQRNMWEQCQCWNRVEILYWILAVIGSQWKDWWRGWMWSLFFGLEDEPCWRVLNTLKFVSEVFGASIQETVAVIETEQYVRTAALLCKKKWSKSTLVLQYCDLKNGLNRPFF